MVAHHMGGRLEVHVPHQRDVAMAEDPAPWYTYVVEHHDAIALIELRREEVIDPIGGAELEGLPHPDLNARMVDRDCEGNRFINLVRPERDHAADPRFIGKDS